jgi:calcineurin-like phosphoesterase family protein
MSSKTTARAVGVFIAALYFGSAACGGRTPLAPTSGEVAPAAQPATPSSPAPAPTPAPVPDATLVGAGDIVKCNAPEAEETARLLDRIPGTVMTLGDNVYPNSTAALLEQCYAPTWGRHLSRTIAAPGNHDWEVSAGAPYFAYFGAAAGPGGLGYFSTTLGAWHLVVLNSNVGASAGSPQYEWLKGDLAASTAACTLALWHAPVFSSGTNGNSPQMRDAWRLLQASGASIVVNGHDHEYERFAPQDADGHVDGRGIREFVAGTGGGSLSDRIQPQPNSEVLNNHTFGVLQLTLKTGSYDWRFVPIDGQTFSDSGSAACVGR